MNASIKVKDASKRVTSVRPGSGESPKSTPPTAAKEVFPAPWKEAFLTGAQTSSCLEVMDEVRTLLKFHKQDLLLQQWSRINEMLDTPDFTVAVIGETSSGKSTLLNSLLGESLLPAGNSPTTSMVTRIVAGEQRKLTQVSPDHSRKTSELNRRSLEKFKRSTGTNVSGTLELQITDSWLKNHHLSFLDTPGVSSLNDSQAAPVLDAIARSDATLVVISALSPLSLIEKAFVEEHIVSRNVPKVALVIARLDLVKDKERSRLVDYIVTKANAWSPKIEIWLPDEKLKLATVSTVVVQGSQAMRQALETWADDNQRAAARVAHAYAQLFDILQALKSVLVARLQLLEADNAARNQAVEQAKVLLKGESAKWQDLRLAMKEKGLEAETWLRQSLAETTPILTQRMILDANRAPNPKDWWLKELPFRLSQELRGLSRNLSSALAERLNRDAQWLTETARKTFAVQFSPRAQAPLVELGLAEVTESAGKLTDLKRYRTTTRVLSIFVGTGGFLLFGPFGALFSGLAALGTEMNFNSKIQAQRDQLAKLLEDGIFSVMQRAGEAGKNRIRDVYQQLTEETRIYESSWQQARLKAIASLPAKATPDSIKQMNGQLQTVETLAKKLGERIR